MPFGAHRGFDLTGPQVEGLRSVTVPPARKQLPTPDLVESILRGTSANLLGLILTFGQHVLLVPLFLHSWGSRLYGDWLALTAASGYLSLLEGGFQRYLTNRMNAAWELGDSKQFHRLLHTGIVFSVAVTGVGAVVVALGAFFVPWPNLLRLSTLDQSLSGATLMLAGLSLLASIPAGIVGGVYRCLKEYPRGVSLANLVRSASGSSDRCRPVAARRNPDDRDTAAARPSRRYARRCR